MKGDAGTAITKNEAAAMQHPQEAGYLPAFARPVMANLPHPEAARPAWGTAAGRCGDACRLNTSLVYRLTPFSAGAAASTWLLSACRAHPGRLCEPADAGIHADELDTSQSSFGASLA